MLRLVGEVWKKREIDTNRKQVCVHEIRDERQNSMSDKYIDGEFHTRTSMLFHAK